MQKAVPLRETGCPWEFRGRWGAGHAPPGWEPAYWASAQLAAFLRALFPPARARPGITSRGWSSAASEQRQPRPGHGTAWGDELYPALLPFRDSTPEINADPQFSEPGRADGRQDVTHPEEEAERTGADRDIQDIHPHPRCLPENTPVPLRAPAYLQRLHQHPHIGLGDAQRDAQRRGQHDEPEHQRQPGSAQLPHGPHDLHGGHGRQGRAGSSEEPAGSGRCRLTPALKARGRPGPPPARPAALRPGGSGRAGPPREADVGTAAGAGCSGWHGKLLVEEETAPTGAALPGAAGRQRGLGRRRKPETSSSASKVKTGQSSCVCEYHRG